MLIAHQFITTDSQIEDWYLISTSIKIDEKRVLLSVLLT